MNDERPWPGSVQNQKTIRSGEQKGLKTIQIYVFRTKYISDGGTNEYSLYNPEMQTLIPKCPARRAAGLARQMVIRGGSYDRTIVEQGSCDHRRRIRTGASINADAQPGRRLRVWVPAFAGTTNCGGVQGTSKNCRFLFRVVVCDGGASGGITDVADGFFLISRTATQASPRRRIRFWRSPGLCRGTSSGRC